MFAVAALKKRINIKNKMRKSNSVAADDNWRNTQDVNINDFTEWC